MINEGLLASLNVSSRDFKEEELHAIVSMLTSDERIVFDILKNSENALTALEVYDLYINEMIKREKILAERLDTLVELLADEFGLGRGISISEIPHVKRACEIKAKFIRKLHISVPTNRTITRILENLKDAGYLVKRDPKNKRAKAYWALHPNMKVLLRTEKKMTVDDMKKQLQLIKEFLEKNKDM